jgi:hypothetical protein
MRNYSKDCYHRYLILTINLIVDSVKLSQKAVVVVIQEVCNIWLYGSIGFISFHYSFSSFIFLNDKRVGERSIREGQSSVIVESEGTYPRQGYTSQGKNNSSKASEQIFSPNRIINMLVPCFQ